MRGLRSTVILFVLLVGLGAYIYFVESKRPTSQEVADKKEKVFTTDGDTALEGEKIEELTVKGTSGETVTRKTIPRQQRRYGRRSMPTTTQSCPARCAR